MKKTLLLFGGLLVLIGLLMALDSYRDIQKAKTIFAEFKPDLMPIKDIGSLTVDETESYQACLYKKIAANVSTNDENAFCRCFATGISKYVATLLPSPEKKGVDRLAMMLRNTGEMGAKGAVIMKVCAENTSVK